MVLSGSGVHDGSEIQETVSLLIHLSRLNAEVKCFAPDIPQADVINHLKGAPGIFPLHTSLYIAFRFLADSLLFIFSAL